MRIDLGNDYEEDVDYLYCGRQEKPSFVNARSLWISILYCKRGTIK